MINRKSTFFKVFERNYQHSKALTIFFFLVFVMRKMGTCQTLEIPVFDLVSRSPTIVNDHFMNGDVCNAVEQDSESDIKPKIKPGHDTELHIQPTWNGKNQRKPIVPLKTTSIRLMVVSVKRPAEGVHHILVGEPRHKLHGPKGDDDY